MQNPTYGEFKARLERGEAMPARSWQAVVTYDGTLVDYINKTMDFLADAPPEVTSASFIFEGRAIVLTREQAMAWKRGE